MAKPVTSEQVLDKLQALCNAAEHCRSEVAKRLAKVDLPAAEKSAILKRLVRDGFVDDARYARAFAHDRLRFSLWGRFKIALALRAKQIDKEHIDDALEALDEEEYRQVARRVVRSAFARCKRDEDGAIPYPERLKAFRRAAAHGFETNVIKTCISEFNL